MVRPEYRYLPETCNWALAVDSWLLAHFFSLRRSSIPQPPFPHKPTKSPTPSASSQRARDISGPMPKTNRQVPYFQYFAYKSHGLKILQPNFSAAPIKSRFYGPSPNGPFSRRHIVGTVAGWLTLRAWRSRRATRRRLFRLCNIR